MCGRTACRTGYRLILPAFTGATAAISRTVACVPQLSTEVLPSLISKAIDLLDFDLVIAMDDQNYEDLMHIAPSVEATHKIRRMADFLSTRRISYIPDPYYMGAEGFAHVLDLLEEACRNLLDTIKKAEF